MAAQGFSQCPLGECVEKHATVRTPAPAPSAATFAAGFSAMAAAMERMAEQMTQIIEQAAESVSAACRDAMLNSTDLTYDNERGIVCPACRLESGPLPPMLTQYVCPCTHVTPLTVNPMQYILSMYGSAPHIPYPGGPSPEYGSSP